MRAPARVVEVPAQRRGAQLRGQRREVGGGIGGHAAAAARAQRAERRRHRAEAGQSERVGVVGIGDGVQHHALDAVGMGARVGERERRPVGDPEQRHPLHAEGGADRLHVGHGVRRRVVAPARSEPPRALLGGGGRAQARVALDRGAAEQSAAPGPALVEAVDRVAAREPRHVQQHARHLRHSRPAGPAGQVHQRPARSLRARDPGDAQVDGPGHGAGPVERDPEPRALRPLRAGAPAQPRLGGDRTGGQEDGQRRERDGDGPHAEIEPSVRTASGT